MGVMDTETMSCGNARGYGTAGEGGARRSKADLHIHSKYSDRPTEWFLRRIGAPESFVEPRAVYDRCRAAGMDYVTISDHNCIRGALEIADLPGVFISSELTTYFPEDRCKIHCVVSGISARHFDELQEVRQNIYELRDYLRCNGIIHTIAHPLYRINDRLTVAHFEKLLVMFDRFETINGARNNRACAIARAIMESLDETAYMRLADRHDIAPCGATPWIKSFTGGSDDHGGLYAASAYTETPYAATVFDFLDHLREGRHAAAGTGGSSLQLAHSLVHIAQAYIHDRLAGSAGAELIGTLFRNLGGALDATPERVNPVRATARRILAPIVRRQKLRQLSETERLLVEEFRLIAAQPPAVDAHADEPYEARYALVSRLAHQLSYTFISRGIEQLKAGSLLDAVQSAASLSPVLLGIAPYLTAFSAQHKDSAFLRELSAVYPAGKPAFTGRGGKAWITDTFNDVNGVAKTIHKLASLAEQAGRPITVLTSLAADSVGSHPFAIRNFPPVGTFAVPEYPELAIALPPVLDIVRYIEASDFEELIISTPGPMGLIGLLAARLLGLPAQGVYHTDFPLYIERWTDDEAMGQLTRRFMRWFYGKMTKIHAPTRAYMAELEMLGFDRAVLDVLPRGVDLHDFNPSFRQPDFWRRFGLNGAAVKFVYVGRVSSEKNIDVLLQAFRMLIAQGQSVELAVVGDGPDLARLRGAYGDVPGLTFTGYLHGAALAAAYASSYALVFPSMSDTFGNVVLEAHACGIPAIVSDKGGPQEIVRAHDSGMVVDAQTPEPFAAAMHRLIADTDAYARYCRNALASAQDSRWELVLAKL